MMPDVIIGPSSSKNPFGKTLTLIRSLRSFAKRQPKTAIALSFIAAGLLSIVGSVVFPMILHENNPYQQLVTTLGEDVLGTLDNLSGHNNNNGSNVDTSKTITSNDGLTSGSNPNMSGTTNQPACTGGYSDAVVLKSANSGHALRYQTSVNIGQLSQNILPTEINDVSRAKKAYAAWIRADLTWENVETKKGQYNWSSYDAMISDVNSAGTGTKLLLILDYGNTLYNEGHSDTSYVPTDVTGFQAFMKAYGTFAYQAALHFKGSRAVTYEIWNEPYTTDFWKPTPNAVQYAELDNYAAQLIHMANPAAVVTTAALDGGGLHDATNPTYMLQFLKSGGGKYNDAVSVHPYTSVNPEVVIGEYKSWQSFVQKYLSAAMPLWVTEWGYPSYASYYSPGMNPLGEDMLHFQAKMDARELLSTWIAGFRFVNLYKIRDYPYANVEPPFGLFDSNYNSKVAMQAVQTLMHNTDVPSYRGTVQTPNAHLYIVKAATATTQTLILWTDSETQNQSVTFSVKPMSATDYLGNTLSASTAMTIHDTPVYVVFNNANQPVNVCL